MPINQSDIAWDAPPKIDALSVEWDKPKQSAEYARGRNDFNPAGRGLAGALNGPLMGFADEIGGALGAVARQMTVGGDFAQNYRDKRDYIRGLQDQNEASSPATNAITQLMASAPLMALNPFGTAARVAAPAAASKVVGMLPNMGRAAATGFGFGSVTGAGNSTADSMGGVATDAAKGGLASAALAAGSVPVQNAVGAVAGNIQQRVSQNAAYQHAAQKIAEAFSRDARGDLFMSGGANPLMQAQSRFRKLGPEARLVDGGGSNTNQLLDTLAILPGRTKEMVKNVQQQRTAGVGARMRDAADDALGTQGQRLNTTVERLIADRSKAATPLYEQVRRVTLQPTDDLVQMVQAADQLGAAGIGKKIALGRQMEYTLDPSKPGAWRLADLDNLKRGLDDIVANNTIDGRMTPLGAAVNDLRGKLVQQLDDLTLNPQTGQSVYRQARDAFAGPSALIDAAKAGRTALAKDDAAIQSLTQGMTQSEMEAFRVGAYEALRAKLGTQSGQTNIMNMWKEPATQEKLKAIFGDERSFREFASGVARESRLKRIQSVGNGSQTAGRQAGMGDLDVQALTDVGTAAAAAKTGNVITAFGAARNAWNRVATPQTTRDQMGSILLSRGGDAQANMNSMRRLIEQINEQNALYAGNLGILSSQVGGRLPF